MKRTSFADTLCPIARTLDMIGEWWSLLILRDVFCGIQRFDKLSENLGISRNVLTDRLRTLVESGILEKKLYQEKPNRYEYHLTISGRELLPMLAILTNWGNRWLPTKTETTVDLVHDACGQPLTLLMQCNYCDKDVTTDEVRANNFENKLQIAQSLTKNNKQRSSQIKTKTF